MSPVELTANFMQSWWLKYTKFFALGSKLICCFWIKAVLIVNCCSWPCWCLLCQGLLAISFTALQIMLPLSFLCSHSYLRQFFNAGIIDGYRPNSPRAAKRLHLLCTDVRSLHIFWFRTSKCKFSQAFDKASLEKKIFLLRKIGSKT